MPATKVQKSVQTVKNDDGSEREQVQFRMTVPKDLAEAFDLEGDLLEWTAKSQNTFELTRVETE